MWQVIWRRRHYLVEGQMYALLDQRQCLVMYNMTYFHIMATENGRHKEHHLLSLSSLFLRSMNPEPNQLTLINIKCGCGIVYFCVSKCLWQDGVLKEFCGLYGGQETHTLGLLHEPIEILECGCVI